MKNIIIDGNSLTITEIASVAFAQVPVRLSTLARMQIKRARDLVEYWIRSGEIVYGVSTGFGEFANVRIDQHDTEQLQENLILTNISEPGRPQQHGLSQCPKALEGSPKYTDGDCH